MQVLSFSSQRFVVYKHPFCMNVVIFALYTQDVVSTEDKTYIVF